MLNLSENVGFSGALGSAALAGLSGAATTHSHTANLPFAIKGVAGILAAGTATPTTNSSPTDRGAVSPSLAAGTALAVTAPAAGFRGALVVWTIDASGVKRIRSRGWFEAADGGPLTLNFPDIPDTEIPLAYHTVKAATTVVGTWTFGSSNWNATGITVGTVVNVVGAVPQAGAVVLS